MINVGELIDLDLDEHIRREQVKAYIHVYNATVLPQVFIDEDASFDGIYIRHFNEVTQTIDIVNKGPRGEFLPPSKICRYDNMGTCHPYP